ncbi:uncharacterized protein [Diabrotica undecimpunctata]|uniref:uncharacterized protein n=1 Tax=Diabrotica undecimpunctata TaxID=50387 RepID=UPI003B641B19
MEEIREIILRLKRGRASGNDKITAEILKNMGEMEMKCLGKFVIKHGIRARSQKTEKWALFYPFSNKVTDETSATTETSKKHLIDPHELRKAIMSLYKKTRNRVRTDNMESEEFRVNESLRQGGVRGPTLFNIVLDDVMKETREETSRIFVGHTNLEMIQIAECAFADDLVVFGRNEDTLKRNLQIWRDKLENVF